MFKDPSWMVEFLLGKCTLRIRTPPDWVGFMSKFIQLFVANMNKNLSLSIHVWHSCLQILPACVFYVFNHTFNSIYLLSLFRIQISSAHGQTPWRRGLLDVYGALLGHPCCKSPLTRIPQASSESHPIPNQQKNAPNRVVARLLKHGKVHAPGHGFW